MGAARQDQLVTQLLATLADAFEPRSLPLTVEAAVELARERGVIDAIAPGAETELPTTPLPSELRELYVRVTAIAGFVSPPGELPGLRRRFAALVAAHIAELEPRSPSSPTSLTSYLPVEQCTPFGVDGGGDLYFVSAVARSGDGDLAVMRLVHDDAGRVQPWARSPGEHVALAGVAEWARRSLVEDEIARWMYGRRVDVVLAEPIRRLFVYGTLRPGQAAYPLLAPYAIESRLATMTGAIYAFADRYPGAVAGDDGLIAGELVELRDVDAAFGALDEYEGAEFVRVIVHVTPTSGDPVDAWCYVLADARLAGRGIRIASGDWLIR